MLLSRLIYGQIIWMVIAVLLLAYFGALTLEQFFILSFLGFLALVEMIVPFTDVTPRWRTRIRWTIIIGVLVFLYILLNQIIEILS